MKFIRNHFPLILSIYIILIFVVPLITNSAKGSSLNSILKAAILVIFFFCALCASRYRMSNSIIAWLIILLFCLSQAFGFIFFAGSNIVSTIGQIFVLLVSIAIFPQIIVSKKAIKEGIIVYLLFNYFAITYNYLIHFDIFVSLRFITNIEYQLFSFFDNKNTYGMVLFIGLVLLFYLFFLIGQKKKFVFVLLIMVQLFAIAVSMCRTALLCSVVFVLLYLIANIKRNYLLLSLSLVGMLVAFLVPSLRDFILNHLARVEVGTFRDSIYTGALHLFAESPVFGYGFDNWSTLLLTRAGNLYTHNGFYTVLLDGGLLNMFSYVFIFIVILRRAFVMRVYNKKCSQVLFIFFICFVIYSCFESVVFCSSSAANHSFTLVGLLIPTLHIGAAEKEKDSKDIYNIPQKYFSLRHSYRRPQNAAAASLYESNYLLKVNK